MRISPIGLLYHKDVEKAKAMAANSSSMTHPYPTNAEACQLYTALIVEALHGASREDLARVAAREIEELRDPDLSSRLRRYKTMTSWDERDADDIKSSGYVVSTIEAALWSFFTTSSFEEGAITAVNLGSCAPKPLASETSGGLTWFRR